MNRPKKDMTVARIIGRNLSALRKARGVRQKDVAAAINMNIGVMNLAESGQVEPTLTTLRRLADYYGVTIDELTINKQ